MLNKDGIRMLSYIVQVDDIRPIEGADSVEIAVVGGWTIMVKKEQFKKGDWAIYFEIDSKVPETKPFEFLASKHYKIKTQKYFKGTVISQGLLMSLNDFPDIFEYDNLSGIGWLYKNKKNAPVNIHDDLTALLKVKYSVAEDNKRKSNIDKYTKMAARHNKLFKTNKIVKWLFQRTWGKKLLFIFLGSKKDKRTWPMWVRKTDEERVQNLPQLFPGDNTIWVVTEKIDGSSTTFTMKGRGRREDYYVCSRNVCFDTPEKADKCYYDTNIYLEMEQKYNIKEVLRQLLNEHKDWTFVTIQGETYGDGVQKRTYNLKDERKFMAFNLVYGLKDNDYIRMNPIQMTEILSKYQVPCIPILDKEFKIPQTMDEMIHYADGKSILDGGMREGVVLRTLDGESSFKSVSNDFLIKYHQ